MLRLAAEFTFKLISCATAPGGPFAHAHIHTHTHDNAEGNEHS